MLCPALMSYATYDGYQRARWHFWSAWTQIVRLLESFYFHRGMQAQIATAPAVTVPFAEPMLSSDLISGVLRCDLQTLLTGSQKS